jgi:cytochrome c
MQTQTAKRSGRWRSSLLALFACAVFGALFGAVPGALPGASAADASPGAGAAPAEVKTATGTMAASGDPSRGERLLAQYHCGSCHTIPGVASARGRVAVTLESFGRRSYIAGRLPNTPQLLADWIVAPSALIPQTTMPAMGVSADDAKDMAAYLGKLR